MVSYTGQVIEIPFLEYGMTGTTDIAGMLPSQLLMAKNVSYENGAMQKEGGVLRYPPPGTSPLNVNAGRLPAECWVQGGYDWWPNTATQYMVLYAGLFPSLQGAIFVDPGDGTMNPAGIPQLAITTGLAYDCFPVFVGGGRETASAARKLFIINGVDQMRVLANDVQSTAAVASPSADWSAGNRPVTGCIHEGRLWVAAGHRVYWSNVANHEDFTTASPVTGNIAVFTGEGDRIEQIISYKHVLVIFKSPGGIYAIDTTDSNTANWTVSRITEAIGVPSPQSVVITETDLIFVDYHLNIQMLSGIQEFGSLGTKNLSYIHRFDKFLFRNGVTRRDKVRLLYQSRRRELHMAVTLPGSLYGGNTHRVVLDFNGNVPRFRISNNAICEAMWLRRRGKNENMALMVAGGWHYVYMLQQGRANEDVFDPVSEFKTGPLDFGIPMERKAGQFLTIIANPSDIIRTVNTDAVPPVTILTTPKIFVDTYWDGRYTEQLTFDLNGVGTSILGEMVLGTSVLATSDEQVLTLTKPMKGSGFRLQLRFWSNTPETSFSLSKIYCSFTMSDRRAQPQSLPA